MAKGYSLAAPFLQPFSDRDSYWARQQFSRRLVGGPGAILLVIQPLRGSPLFPHLKTTEEPRRRNRHRGSPRARKQIGPGTAFARARVVRRACAKLTRGSPGLVRHRGSTYRCFGRSRAFQAAGRQVPARGLSMISLKFCFRRETDLRPPSRRAKADTTRH
jgi:hypothetical protein